MTEGSVFVKLILFSLPIIASGMLQLVFNVTDTIIVGNFDKNGQAALAAVGACAPLINLIVNFFMGLSVGAGISVAKYIGAKRGRSKEENPAYRNSGRANPGNSSACRRISESNKAVADIDRVEERVCQTTLYMRGVYVRVPASMVFNYCTAITLGGKTLSARWFFYGRRNLQPYP